MTTTGTGSLLVMQGMLGMFQRALQAVLRPLARGKTTQRKNRRRNITSIACITCTHRVMAALLSNRGTARPRRGPCKRELAGPRTSPLKLMKLAEDAENREIV